MALENKEKLEVVKPFTDTEIEQHAAKVAGRRNLREVSIITDDGYEFVYLIKKPTRSVMEAITDKKKDNDLNAVAKLMLGCVLEGDREAYEHDGAIYEELLKAVAALISTAEGHLKKL